MTNDVKAIPARKNMSRPAYADIPGPISAADADGESQATRAFTMPEATLPEPPKATPPLPVRPYPIRTYTVDAVSPAGFPVHLAFSDLTIEQFEQKIAKLQEIGYTAPAMATPAADPTGWRTLPDGTPLCPKHNVPMRKRERQGDAWWSHNAGSKDAPLYCKGYAGPDSPGYEVD